MYMKYNVINSDWYTKGRDYLLNETGESFSILDLQSLLCFINVHGLRDSIPSTNTYRFTHKDFDWAGMNVFIDLLHPLVTDCVRGNY